MEVNFEMDYDDVADVIQRLKSEYEGHAYPPVVVQHLIEHLEESCREWDRKLKQ